MQSTRCGSESLRYARDMVATNIKCCTHACMHPSGCGMFEFVCIHACMIFHVHACMHFIASLLQEVPGSKSWSCDWWARPRSAPPPHLSCAVVFSCVHLDSVTVCVLFLLALICTHYGHYTRATRAQTFLRWPLTYNKVHSYGGWRSTCMHAAFHVLPCQHFMHACMFAGQRGRSRGAIFHSSEFLHDGL